MVRIIKQDFQPIIYGVGVYERCGNLCGGIFRQALLQETFFIMADIRIKDLP